LASVAVESARLNKELMDVLLLFKMIFYGEERVKPQNGF
jgi:hypothetical protein